MISTWILEYMAIILVYIDQQSRDSLSRFQRVLPPWEASTGIDLFPHVIQVTRHLELFVSLIRGHTCCHMIYPLQWYRCRFTKCICHRMSLGYFPISLLCHMQSVTFKGQMSTSRSRAMVKTILCTYFCYFWRNKNALMQLTSFCGDIHCPLNGFTTVVLYLIVWCYAQPRSILVKMAIRDQILKFVYYIDKGQGTWHIWGDTWHICGSPKQFDLDRSRSQRWDIGF